MENMEIRAHLAENIQFYRKQRNLTQLELAEKINYSDKAISKWERGEGVPDIYVLASLAEIFEVTVDDLLFKKPIKVVSKNTSKKKHFLIASAAFVLVWIVAIAFYSIASMAGFTVFDLWLSFIVAIPASFIVALVFSSIWGGHKLILTFASLIVWGVALALSLIIPVSNSYLFFIIAVPVQALIILGGYAIRMNHQKKLS